jgi:SsrA-binding protein
VATEKSKRRVVCANRRAHYQFALEEHYDAGLVLLGSEVKSLRAGEATLEDAWVGFEHGCAMLMGAHIAPYPQANRQNHEPTRPRKLLLHKSEEEKLRQRVRERGLTIVPLQLYFEGAWCKLSLAVGRGKKLHDKRQALKAREDRKEVQRATRGGGSSG